MRKGLSEFSGVKRRFTPTGLVGGVQVIDDYAHHPVEIATVLKTARVVAENNHGRVVAVMQPHRYSRLSELFEDFCTCFNDAETVILAPVYAAGEKPIDGADHYALAEKMRAYGHRRVMVIERDEELAPLLAPMVQSGDYVVCMGAGDITRWAYALPDQLEALLKVQAA